MFSSKLSTALRWKNLVRHTSEINDRCKQTTHYSCTCNSQNDFRNYNEVKTNVFQPPLFVKNLCTKQLPKNADVFGDLGYNSHQRCEMDDMEKEEEEFTSNETQVPKWQKLSPGQYANLIKSHVTKGDLTAAMGVLDIIKENRDKPTVYLYSLLIRSFAVQGHLSQCFKLYNQMKKRSLRPNDAVYNSLLNACAASKHTERALERLYQLRQLFHKEQYPLNETHYNTMIKAYSWHGKTYEAFELVDEMQDKRICIGEITYCVLLHAAISDKQAGIRYALSVWHMMKTRRQKRNLLHYNLLLKAIRDTKFGLLGINDVLIPGRKDTQICLSENERPDLLATPPTLSALALPMIESGTQETSENATSKVANPVTVTSHLNKVLAENRLLLFGGYENILRSMENESIQPDAKTMTLLMELLPNSVAVEDSFVEYLINKKITVDVQFYNMLIRKRAMRHEYVAAKDVLSIMQRMNLSPDIVTFGVLSMGCKRRKDGIELIEGMQAIGYMPNAIILGTLINGACHENNLHYVLDLLNYMDNNRMKLNAKMLEMLETLDKSILQLLKNKDKRDRAKVRILEREYKEFKEKCRKFIDKATN